MLSSAFRRGLGRTGGPRPGPDRLRLRGRGAHVALMVQHGSGAVLSRCVGFDGVTITGEQVLQMSGLEYQGAQYGGALGKAICQIDYEPQTYPPGCFNASSPYWAMFVSRGGGGWSVSNLGVSNQIFRDGDAEGWRFDQQNGAAAQPPSPAGVCEVAAPPQPSAAPVTAPTPPAVTSAPASMASAEPSPTPAPTATPTATPTEAPGPSPTASPPAASSGPGQVAPVQAAQRGGSPPWGLLAAGAAAALLIGLVVVQSFLRP